MRQWADTLADVRRDHVARYEWAGSLVGGCHVIDAACGCGYGAALLHDCGCRVTAIDIAPNAIEYGKEHWARSGITWMRADLDKAVLPAADAVISFETIEHIEDPLPFLRMARSAAPMLLASVPNENVIPKRPDNFRHHFRHYTPAEFTRLLALAGWTVNEEYGQLDQVSPVERGVVGRTIVVSAR